MKNFVLSVYLIFTAFISSPQADFTTVANGIHINAKSNTLIPLIMSAQKSIKIEIYTMTDPNVRKALRTQLARKIKIQVVKDPTPFNVKCNVFTPPGTGEDLSADCDDQKKLVLEVRNAGGAYVPFNKNVLCGNSSTNCFEHGKLLIIDNRTVMISSGNYDPSNLCDTAADPERCNRDYSFVIREPKAVKAFLEVFTRDLLGQPYNLADVLNRHKDSLVTISPLALEPILGLIMSAKKYILIQNQYTTIQQVNDALILKAKQGVEVLVNVASFCSFSKPNETQTAKIKSLFTAFDQAGVQSRLFTDKQVVGSKPGYLHAKAIIVDGVAAWVGSINFSAKAFNENREFGYFFNYPAWISILQNQIKQDVTNPNSESWQESLQCLKDTPRDSDQ